MIKLETKKQTKKEDTIEEFWGWRIRKNILKIII